MSEIYSCLSKKLQLPAPTTTLPPWGFPTWILHWGSTRHDAKRKCSESNLARTHFRRISLPQ